MCFWTDCSISQYVRNHTDQAIIFGLVNVHMFDAIDRTIYPERAALDGSFRKAYGMDCELRPEIVAILIEMLDHSDSKMYPKSKIMADKIADRVHKCKRPGIINRAESMKQVIELNVLSWHNQIKGAKNLDGRTTLDRAAQKQILLFAETMIRAAQIYHETLMRNRCLWDRYDSNYVGAIAAAEFNMSFDMSYIELAISDLDQDCD